MSGTIVPGDHAALMVAERSIAGASGVGCLRIDHGFVSLDHYLL